MTLDPQARHALKTALAAVLALTGYACAGVTSPQHATWASMAAVLVMQSNLGSLLKAAAARGVGTAIGSAAGVVAVVALGPSPLTLALAVAATIYACGKLDLRDSYRLAGAAVVLVVLGAHTRADALHTGLARLSDVMVGLASAALVQGFFWPAHAAVELRDGLVKSLRLARAYLDAMPGDADALRAARVACRDQLAKNRDLLADMRREPGAHKPDEGRVAALLDQVDEIHLHLRSVEHAVRVGGGVPAAWAGLAAPAGAALEWLARRVAHAGDPGPPPDVTALVAAAEDVLDGPCAVGLDAARRNTLYYNLRSVARHIARASEILSPSPTPPATGLTPAPRPRQVPGPASDRPA